MENASFSRTPKRKAGALGETKVKLGASKKITNPKNTFQYENYIILVSFSYKLFRLKIIKN